MQPKLLFLCPPLTIVLIYLVYFENILLFPRHLFHTLWLIFQHGYSNSIIFGTMQKTKARAPSCTCNRKEKSFHSARVISPNIEKKIISLYVKHHLTTKLRELIFYTVVTVFRFWIFWDISVLQMLRDSIAYDQLL